MSSKSPAVYALVDPLTLKRLDLPKLGVQAQGIDFLLLEKQVHLVYNVNDNIVTKRLIDTRGSTAISNPGFRFTCPQDVRRTIWNMRFTYTTSATVGNRTVTTDKNDQDDVPIQRFTSGTVTAGNTIKVTVGLYTGGNSDQDKPLFAPIHMEPNQYILIDDAGNIDPTDTFTWKIEYQDVAL